MLSPARIVREAKRPAMLVPLLAVVILLGCRSELAGEALSRRPLGARGRCAADFATGTIRENLAPHMRSPSEAEKSIPGDPALAKLWPVISYQTFGGHHAAGRRPSTAATTSTPTRPGNWWERLRLRMFASRVECSSGSSRSRVSAQFLRTTHRPGASVSGPPGDPSRVRVTLDEAAKIPAGMVRVSPGTLLQDAFHSRL